jgi:5-methylcytosine-specific restriction protein A
MRALLSTIAEEYLSAKQTPFKDNAFGELVRNESKRELQRALGRDDLIYRASVGQGRWAEIPWIAIFNPELAQSAQSGPYLVYLFTADLSGLYLVQGQGVTQVRNEFGSEQRGELLRRAELMRARVPEYENHFTSGTIALGGETRLATDYDDATAYYRYYETADLPSETELVNDLKVAVHLYDLLVSRGGTDNLETTEIFGVENAGENTTIDERRKLVRHYRLERRSDVGRKVKRAQGYQCRVCGIDFAHVYGELGEHYIEAHHLTPISSIQEGEILPQDVHTDFAVLCANCHRMVHRHTPPLHPDDVANLPGVKRFAELLRQLQD